MDISKIISISGKSGLSKIISQSRNGLIVESIVDGKRSAVHGTERVSSLEDISIFTLDEDILLTEVFKMMLDASKGKQVLSHKSSPEDLKNYLKEILPNYDEEKVYVSDIKKLVQWFNLLIDKNIIKLEKKQKKSTEPIKESAEKVQSETTDSNKTAE